MRCLCQIELVPAEYADRREISIAGPEAAPVAVLAFRPEAGAAAWVAASAIATMRLTHGSCMHLRGSGVSIAALEPQPNSAANKLREESSFEPLSNLRRTKPLCGSSGLAVSGLARAPEDPG